MRSRPRTRTYISSRTGTPTSTRTGKRGRVLCWALTIACLGTTAACGSTSTQQTADHRPTPRQATVPTGGAGAVGVGPTSATSTVPTSSATPTPAESTQHPSTDPAARRPADGTVLVEPNQGMQTIDEFVASAQHSVDMTMYELADPQMEKILIADATRGVDVRVLLDRAYHGGAVNKDAAATLSAGGVHVAWANPRTIIHQKTITVDDAESCIMTLNLTAEYYPTTRDLAVFDTNPADISAIVSAFNQDFTGVVPGPASSGSGDLVWSPGSTPALVSLIGSATTNLDIESEELDDPAIVAALVSAARRGVSVRITMEANTQWDPAFNQITAAGGHIFTYNDPNGFYIHAKFVDVDDTTVWIGSENFTVASLVYNRELGIVLHHPATAEQVASLFDHDAAGATAYHAP